MASKRPAPDASDNLPPSKHVRPVPYPPGQSPIDMLPQELVDMIFPHLDDVKDIANLRMVAKKFARDSRHQIFESITIVPIEWNLDELLEVANNTVYDDETVETSSMVKHIVLEDVVSRRPTALRYPSSEDRDLYQCFYNDFTKDMYLGAKWSHAIEAVENLDNLETLEYYWGFKEGPPEFRPKCGPEWLYHRPYRVEPPRAAQKEYYKRMWNNRRTAEVFEATQWDTAARWAPAVSPWDRMNPALRTAGRLVFEQFLRAALSNSNRKKPLNLKITAGGNSALDWFAARTGDATDSGLGSLELRYIAENAWTRNAFDPDWRLLTNRALGDVNQFTSVRSLTLAGKDIFVRGYLNLQSMISESDNVSVPGLEVLHLENVRLGKDTVKFLLSLAVDLTMKNILWPRRASSPSGVKPMLKSAKVSGAMVDVADHSPFSNTGIFWFVGTQHQSQQFNDFYKDRIKPASPDANPIPYVSPDVMERWILRGGDLPFRYENRWGRLGLFFRPRDVPNYASYTDRDNDSQ